MTVSGGKGRKLSFREAEADTFSLGPQSTGMFFGADPTEMNGNRAIQADMGWVSPEENPISSVKSSMQIAGGGRMGGHDYKRMFLAYASDCGIP